VDQRFGKEYKLCSKKIIDDLFQNGKRLHSFPYTVIYDFVELPIQNVPFQMVLTVSKRTVRLAHERNKIKRHMREAIRKHKHFLEEILPHRKDNKKNLQIALFLLYTQRKPLQFDHLMKRTKKIIQILSEKLNENHILSSTDT